MRRNHYLPRQTLPERRKYRQKTFKREVVQGDEGGRIYRGELRDGGIRIVQSSESKTGRYKRAREQKNWIERSLYLEKMTRNRIQ